VGKKPNPGRPANRRGSPEAIAKRRAGRAFNVRLQGGGASTRLDGRSQKRRQRLLHELETRKSRGSRQPLKPLDVLSRVNELLDLGESPAAIRKVCRPRSPPRTDSSLVKVVADLHEAYHFRPEAYRFLGINDAVLERAGVLPASAAE
jgi:hypothetical protein